MACMYWLVRFVVDHFIIKVFFRRVDVVGLFRVPESGPVIFVANHNNQFVDPMMLIMNISRVIRFLIASKSLKRPVVGDIARMLRAIGVDRPQDLARKGTGTVSCDTGAEVARGDGTAWTKELEPGFKIKAGETEVTVKSVESDSQCTVSKCPASVSAAAFKVLPRVDQNAVYDAVHEALKGGECIGIFPEGGSHDQVSLLELKPGVAIMALGAVQAGAGAVKIVPCGLNYFEPYSFRSSVCVEFGQPFDVPVELSEQYRTDKRGAVAQLMKLVDDGMKGVMPGVPNYDELQALLVMRALVKPRGKKLSPEENLKISKSFALARKQMGDDPRFAALIEEVGEYIHLLRSAGLHDRDVRLGLAKDASMACRTASGLLTLILLAPITIPAWILGLPLMILTVTLAKREKATALAGSTVKVRGLDVVASYKIIVALVVTPLYQLFVALAATWFFHLSICYFLALFFVVLPLYIAISIRACDLSMRCWFRVRATCLFFCCSATAGLLQTLLVERRQKLQEKVSTFVDDAKILSQETVQAEDERRASLVERHVQTLNPEHVPLLGDGDVSPQADGDESSQAAPPSKKKAGCTIS